jgi:hypothetical protein
MLTLFALMQSTVRMDWHRVFGQSSTLTPRQNAT